MKKMPLFLLTLLLKTGLCPAQPGPVPAAQTYLGEQQPGNTARIFAPGRVSDGMSNRDMAISPAGDEMFYTIQGSAGQVSLILYLHFSGGTWHGPEMAPFSGQYSDLEPAFSYDGKTLYFASNRPADGRQTHARKDYDIFMVKKENGQWAEPIHLDSVINSGKDEYYPSIARNGNLYFTREIENGKGKEDIVVSEWKDGKYQPPYSLPGTINSDKYEFNAFVDPDEQFLLFSSYGRKDDLGGGDMYLSCRNGNGEWMQAIHLDSTINSAALDFSPFISPDKKYLFFTSGKTKENTPYTPPLDMKALKHKLEGPGNGLNDIYWIDWRSLLMKYCHGS